MKNHENTHTLANSHSTQLTKSNINKHKTNITPDNNQRLKQTDSTTTSAYVPPLDNSLWSPHPLGG